ncbi:MAG TPA: hypothetical protein VGK80_02420 [Rhodanobacteraceae bacterium]
MHARHRHPVFIIRLLEIAVGDSAYGSEPRTTVRHVLPTCRSYDVRARGARHQGGSDMPRGDKSSYTGKQKRKAEHIEESYEERGVSKGEAEERAWRTVNKQDKGGRKSGSGRKGAKKSGSRKSASKKSGSRKSSGARKRGSSKKSSSKKSSGRKRGSARKSSSRKSSSARKRGGRKSGGGKRKSRS